MCVCFHEVKGHKDKKFYLHLFLHELKLYEQNYILDVYCLPTIDIERSLVIKKYLPFQVYKRDTESSTWYLPENSLARIGRGYIHDIVFSPDGSVLVAASDLGLWWYDVETYSLLTLWETETPVESVAFSNCGQWIATGSGKGSPINVWDVVSGNCLMELARMETGCNAGFVFSPDRKHLAVGGSWRYNERDYFSVEVYSLPETPQANDGPVCLESTYTYAGESPLAFSPDSTLLAFGAPTGASLPLHIESYPIRDKNRNLIVSHIAVCDVKTGQHLSTLSGFNNDIGGCCFSPCGQYVAAGYRSGPICVWKVPSDHSTDKSPWYLHKVYQEKDKESIYCAVNYSPEGVLRTVKRSLDSDTVSVRDPDQGKTLYQYPNQIGHCSIDFYNSTRLAIASDYEAHVWTLGDQHSTCVSQLHPFPAYSLDFSLDGNRLLAMHRVDGIYDWNVSRPDHPPNVFKSVRKEPNSDASDTYACNIYYSVNISPEGRHFVTFGDENSLHVWELGSEMPIKVFPIQRKSDTATFSPAANLLACRDGAGKIYIWDVATGDLRDTYTADKCETYSDLTFSPNGKYLVSGVDLLYDVEKGEKIEAFDLEEMSIHLFSQDSTQFFCVTREAIELWDIHQCEKVLSIPKPETWFCSDVVALVLSPCGKYLAGCCDEVPEELYLWAIDGGNPLTVFKGHSPIMSLTFSPDTTLLASGSYDGTILLWDLKPYLRNA